MKTIYFDWSEEAEARAIELCEAGLTAREIAVAIGTTKNSVIGRFYRKRIRLKGPYKKFKIKISADPDIRGRLLYSTKH